MNENELSSIILQLCIRIHRKLGPGLFESVYEELLCYELRESGIYFVRQQVVPIYYNELIIESAFRADIIVDNKIILEIKSVETLSPVHKKQLLTYLKLTGIKLGLLLNFNEVLFRNGIVRIANNL